MRIPGIHWTVRDRIGAQSRCAVIGYCKCRIELAGRIDWEARVEGKSRVQKEETRGENGLRKVSI